LETRYRTAIFRLRTEQIWAQLLAAITVNTILGVFHLISPVQGTCRIALEKSRLTFSTNQLTRRQFVSTGYNGAMTKRAIVRTVSEQLNITQQEAKQVVQTVLDAIKETLVEEGRIELRNFGVLEVRERAARKARNPRTGDTVQVKKKRVVVFKAGKALEDAVQEKIKKPNRE